MPAFYIEANGCSLGEYSAADSDAALDACAREAGYRDYAEVAAQFGRDARVCEIDTQKLIADIEAATGLVVMQDAYGVALVGNTAFTTYGELAESIDVDLADYFIV